MKIILASGSPRRRELMKGLGIPFTVELSGEVEEIIPAGTPPEDAPEYLARMKSEAFRPLTGDELLITADTVVICQRQLLGKPAGKADAKRMLRLLSGNRHDVLTGVCLRTARSTHAFTAHTAVFFRPLSDEEIAYYIDCCRPYDKAGAYGAQEWIGYVGIERIEGSYFNVMGLPLQQLYTALMQFAGKHF
ncbi:MAG: Maf family nucleotide pyrophosphatase [Prevotellaceae bacterium]|jgi:septum formation protein|nr:Maf family nucleotide pyrophosphatase [Prevotellaceae bacterium]